MGYYNSFVVRIWSDEQGLSRGSIEHVRTHESLVFGDPAAVVDFIRIHMSTPPSFARNPDDEYEDDESSEYRGTFE